MCVNFLHVDRIFVHYRKRSEFLRTFFEGNSVLFSMLSAVDARFDSCKWQENFFHLSLNFPSALCCTKYVSVFCGPFYSISSRFDVSCHCVFFRLYIPSLDCLFHFLSLSLSLFFFLSISFFVSNTSLRLLFFMKEGARNAGETAREIALFLQNSSTLFTPWKYERDVETVLAIRTFTPNLLYHLCTEDW